MRKDGRFVGVDGTIPEGQGIIMAHLNECHELVEMVCPPLLPLSLSLLTFVCFIISQLKESMNEEETEDEPEAELDDEWSGGYDGMYSSRHNAESGLRVTSGDHLKVPVSTSASGSGSDTDGEGLRDLR